MLHIPWLRIIVFIYFVSPAHLSIIRNDNMMGISYFCIFPVVFWGNMMNSRRHQDYNSHIIFNVIIMLSRCDGLPFCVRQFVSSSYYNLYSYIGWNQEWCRLFCFREVFVLQLALAVVRLVFASISRNYGFRITSRGRLQMLCIWVLAFRIIHCVLIHFIFVSCNHSHYFFFVEGGGGKMM